MSLESALARDCIACSQAGLLSTKEFIRSATHALYQRARLETTATCDIITHSQMLPLWNHRLISQPKPTHIVGVETGGARWLAPVSLPKLPRANYRIPIVTRPGHRADSSSAANCTSHLTRDPAEVGAYRGIDARCLPTLHVCCAPRNYTYQDFSGSTDKGTATVSFTRVTGLPQRANLLLRNGSA